MNNMRQITRIFYLTDRRKRENDDIENELLIGSVYSILVKGRGQYA
jgi:hypothetical protein